MSESKTKTEDIEKYIKDLIVKAVEEKYGNDDVDDVVELIKKRVSQDFLHKSRPIVMAYIGDYEEDGKKFQEIVPFVGQKSKESIEIALSRLTRHAYNFMNAMDARAMKASKEEGKNRIITPGNNGNGMVG